MQTLRWWIANGLLLRSIYLNTNNIINKSQVQRKVNRKGCHKGLAPSPNKQEYRSNAFTLFEELRQTSSKINSNMQSFKISDELTHLHFIQFFSNSINILSKYSAVDFHRKQPIYLDSGQGSCDPDMHFNDN